jgi:hypothetical protein
MDYEKIEIMNIPIHSLRGQFHKNYHLFVSKEFREEIKNWKPNTSIRTPYFIWHYWLDDFYTYVIQISILGVESYIRGAVHFELGKRKRIKENYSYIVDPYSIPGEGGTVAKYYKLLPSLIGEEFSLERNQSLWTETKMFYKKIRNPLFHGNKFGHISYDTFIDLLNYIVDLYEWIDSWHNPEELSKGTKYFTKFIRT